MTYTDLIKMRKQAAAILTPEAEQAAMQPAADPAMAGGMPQQGAPMDPSMMGAAPADPAMGGMPQQGAPADPAAAGMATGPQGGQIPPEILQDQAFLQFLQQALGIMLDPNSGTFIDPNGQPIPAELIIRAYQEFQTQMAQQQGQPGAAPMDPSMMGAAPADPAMGGAPMDPAAMGGMPPQGVPMDPAMAGGAPVDPTMAQDPAMAGVPAPEAGMMDPAAAGMPQEAAPMGDMQQPEDPVNAIAAAVMSGVEAVLQEYTAALEKKVSALLDKIETLNKSVDALQSTTDRRTQKEDDEDQQLREELAADLQPTVKTAAVKAPAPISMPTGKVNLFSVIKGGVR